MGRQLHPLLLIIFRAIQGRMPGLNIYRQGGDMPAAYGWKVRNSRTNLFLVDGIERDFYTMDQIKSKAYRC